MGTWKLLATCAVIAGGASIASADTKRSDGKLGIMADLGVPDGGNVALVYRPLRPLRLHAGAGHNSISPGMRAGVSLVPFATWISPTLSVDYGRYREGDANHVVRMVSGDDSFHAQTLERVGYRYVNAHAGIELGRKRATFYIHAGMSRVWGAIHHLDSASDDGTTMVTFTHVPTLTLWTVSARVGLIVYLTN